MHHPFHRGGPLCAISQTTTSLLEEINVISFDTGRPVSRNQEEEKRYRQNRDATETYLQVIEWKSSWRRRISEDRTLMTVLQRSEAGLSIGYVVTH